MSKHSHTARHYAKMMREGAFSMENAEKLWDSVRDLLVKLRGSVPEKCSHCGKPTPPDKLHPDEADTWSCDDCIADAAHGYLGVQE